MDRIILHKSERIDRCIRQIRLYYLGNEAGFRTDFLRQDAVILNIQRACELCIDVANHAVKSKKLGIPKSAADSFRLLEKAGIIPEDLSDKLVALADFRNIAVHDYARLSLEIVEKIINTHLADIELFIVKILKQC